MNKYFWTIAFVVLTSCKAQQFVVVENGRVYPCDEIGTVIYDSTTFKPNVLKITIIEKKGEYTYEVTDKSGNISTNGKHKKTRCVKVNAEKEQIGKEPLRYRTKRYEVVQ